METILPIACELESLVFSDAAADAVEIEVCRDGTWQHPAYGKVTITPQIRESMLANFRANVRRVGDLPLDYDHRQGPASGWLKDLRQDGTSLKASVAFTPTAREQIERGEYRFFSPEWHPNFKDPSTGKEHGATLLGGGLTNRPFFRELAPVRCNEDDPAPTGAAGGGAPAGKTAAEAAEEKRMAEAEAAKTGTEPALTAQQFAELQGRLTAVEAENASLKAKEERHALSLTFSELAFGERKTAKLAPASRTALVDALMGVPTAARKAVVEALTGVQFAELGERGLTVAGDGASGETLTAHEEQMLKDVCATSGQKFEEVKAAFLDNKAKRG
jgi:hypothetical protein